VGRQAVMLEMMVGKIRRLFDELAHLLGAEGIQGNADPDRKDQEHQPGKNGCQPLPPR
jgi:hypothetical protein